MMDFILWFTPAFCLFEVVPGEYKQYSFLCSLLSASGKSKFEHIHQATETKGSMHRKIGKLTNKTRMGVTILNLMEAH